MVCIYCGSETKIYNSRRQKRTNQVWRRHRCLICGASMTSLETVDFATSLLVTHPDKPAQPFSRDKLFLSLHDSLKHRKNAIAASTALTDTVLAKLLPRIKDASIQKTDISLAASDVLKHFDRVALTQYQAFHPVKRR